MCSDNTTYKHSEALRSQLAQLMTVIDDYLLCSQSLTKLDGLFKFSSHLETKVLMISRKTANTHSINDKINNKQCIYIGTVLFSYSSQYITCNTPVFQFHCACCSVLPGVSPGLPPLTPTSPYSPWPPASAELLF